MSRSHGRCTFNFLGNSQTVFQSGCRFYIAADKSSSCSTSSLKLTMISAFNFTFSADVDNLISGSSAFSKTSLNIRKLMVHVLLKPGLENFEHYFTSVGSGQTGDGKLNTNILGIS